MGRPLRDIQPGNWYHLYTRGSNRAALFESRVDWVDFLVRFNRVATRHDIVVVAFALLGNHYHAVIKAGTGNVSRAMQVLHGGYSRGLRHRKGGDAHAFRNRFRTVEIETDEQLLEAVRYVSRNPVRHGLVQRPDEWVWSSYRSVAGLVRPFALLDIPAALAIFDARDPSRARQSFVRFVDWEAYE